MEKSTPRSHSARGVPEKKRDDPHVQIQAPEERSMALTNGYPSRSAPLSEPAQTPRHGPPPRKDQDLVWGSRAPPVVALDPRDAETWRIRALDLENAAEQLAFENEELKVKMNSLLGTSRVASPLSKPLSPRIGASPTADEVVARLQLALQEEVHRCALGSRRIRELEGDRDRLQERVAECEDQLDRLEKQVEAHHKGEVLAQELIARVKSLQKAHESENKKLQARLNDANERLAASKNKQSQQMLGQLQDAEWRVQESRSALEKERSQSDRLRTSLSDAKAELARVHKELSYVKEAEQKQLLDEKEKNTDLTLSLHDTEARLREARESLTREKEAVEDEKRQNAELQRQLSDLQREASQAQGRRDLEIEHKEVIQLQAQVKQAKLQYEDLEWRAGETRAALTKSREDNERLSIQEAELRAYVGRLQTELTAERALREDERRQTRDLTARLTEVEARGKHGQEMLLMAQNENSEIRNRLTESEKSLSREREGREDELSEWRRRARDAEAQWRQLAAQPAEDPRETAQVRHLTDVLEHLIQRHRNALELLRAKVNEANVLRELLLEEVGV